MFILRYFTSSSGASSSSSSFSSSALKMDCRSCLRSLPVDLIYIIICIMQAHEAIWDMIFPVTMEPICKKFKIYLLLNIPACITFSSMFNLYLAAAKIRSSTELTVIRRKTRTSFFCPIRWARSTNNSNLDYIYG